MKAGTKAVIGIVAILLVMLVFPWASITYAKGDDLGFMGLWILSFFVVNPLLTVCLSIMAGTELGKLWWIPLAIAVAFPWLFGVAIGELVWDLYVYSAMYLPLGVIAMLGTHFGKSIRNRKK